MRDALREAMSPEDRYAWDGVARVVYHPTNDYHYGRPIELLSQRELEDAVVNMTAQMLTNPNALWCFLRVDIMRQDLSVMLRLKRKYGCE